MENGPKSCVAGGRCSQSTYHDVEASTASFKSSQSGSVRIAPTTFEKTIQVDAKIGDFVELVFVKRVAGSNLIGPPQYIPEHSGFGFSSYTPTVGYCSTSGNSWLGNLGNTGAWCADHVNNDVYSGNTVSRIVNGYVLVI